MTTNPLKAQHLQRIRAESAYPTFRSLIVVFSILLYVIAGLFLLFGVFGGLVAMFQQGFLPGLFLLILGTVSGLIYAIIGKVSQEALSMLADTADSITDLNSRYEPQPPQRTTP